MDKKHAKKLARRKKLAAKEQRAADLDRRRQGLTFRFEGEAAPEFVEAVRQVVASLDLQDPDVFPEWERVVFRRAGEVGGQRAMAELKRKVADRPDARLFEVNFALHLGQVVFDRIPRETLLRHIPYHEVVFSLDGRFFRVAFRSLERAKGPGGTVYHSRHRPSVEVGGQRLVVAFSEHAMLRICERLCATWPSYAAAGDAFAFFDQCLEFEVCQLHPHTLAFTFWEECAFARYTLAREVMGEGFVEGAPYSFRVGYCPAVVEGGYLKAKTLLFPGYASTPEYGLLVAADLTRERRRELVQLTKAMDASRTVTPEGTALVKWFHVRGVPQIRPGHPRYAPALTKYF